MQINGPGILQFSPTTLYQGKAISYNTCSRSNWSEKGSWVLNAPVIKVSLRFADWPPIAPIAVGF